MKTKQYTRYIIALDNFGHDINGNPIARHTVYGTDDTSAERVTEHNIESLAFDGCPMLYQTKRRRQVGYSTDRDDSAPDVLRSAGGVINGVTVARLYPMVRVHERSAGTMYLIYTKV